MKYGIN